MKLIKQKITRYIGIDETILYVMSKAKSKYKVRSATNILSIKKIYISVNNNYLQISIIIF